MRDVILGSALLGTGGCMNSVLREDDPQLAETLERAEAVRLVGDVTSPIGLNFLKVESVAMVNGLADTGSAPPDGTQKEMLLGEMQTYDTHKPAELLASPQTSLVLVRGFLPPGIRRGQRFDVEVMVPTGSRTTSLRGGWLMPTRLRAVQVSGGAIHTGMVNSVAQGPVLVDAVFKGDEDKVHAVRGRVLGGGVSQTTRKMGLAIRSEHSSVMTSTQIAAAINQRFQSAGVAGNSAIATPKRDNFIELELIPRYRYNPTRYVRVIRGLAFGEHPAERRARLEVLRRKLAEPTTAARASLQLEAIGSEGLPVLLEGLSCRDAECRFYAAEALAYLDQAEAGPVLAELADREPAFRWHALTALAAMDGLAALEGLHSLLDVESVETRYGAFFALRTRNVHHPTVRGERMSDFSLHVVPSKATPMVHFSRSNQPEIVVFGEDQRVDVRAFHYVGERIVLRRQEDGRIKVSRFTPGENDRTTVCGDQLVELVRALDAVGGGYADVLELTRSAREAESYPGRVVIDARPRPGRVYYREEDGGDGHTPSTPVPELFADRLGQEHDEGDARREPPSTEMGDAPLPEWEKADRGFFGKMMDWFSFR